MKQYIFAGVAVCSLYGTAIGMTPEALMQENKRLQQERDAACNAYWRLQADAYQTRHQPAITLGGKRTPLTDLEAQALFAYLEQRKNVQDSKYFALTKSAFNGSVTAYKKYKEFSRIGQIVVSGAVFAGGFTVGVATGFPLGALSYALKKSSEK